MRKLWRANMLHKGGVAALTIQTHLDQTFAQIGDFLTFDLAFTTYFIFKMNFYVHFNDSYCRISTRKSRDAVKMV